jgi:hypothetical protein
MYSGAGFDVGNVPDTDHLWRSISNENLFTKNLAFLLKEAALLPRKLSSNFLFIDFLTFVIPFLNWIRVQKPAKAKSSGTCASGFRSATLLKIDAYGLSGRLMNRFSEFVTTVNPLMHFRS